MEIPYEGPKIVSDSILATMAMVARASQISETTVEWGSISERLAVLNGAIAKQNDIAGRFLLLIIAMHSSNLLYASCSLFSLYRMSRELSLRPGIEPTRLLLGPVAPIDGIAEVWKRFTSPASQVWTRFVRTLIAAPGIETELRSTLMHSARPLDSVRCLALVGTHTAIDLLKEVSSSHHDLDVRCATECELAFLGERILPSALLCRDGTRSRTLSDMLALAVLNSPDGIRQLSDAIKSENGRKCFEILYRGNPLIFKLLGEVSNVPMAIEEKILGVKRQ